MRVALVQFTGSLDKSANVEALTRSVREAVADAGGPGGVDLVVCPEASMLDFGPPERSLADDAEPLDGTFVRRLAEVAREVRATVVAGMFEQPGAQVGADKAHNTLVALGPSGDLVAAYRKLHLYDAFGFSESDKLAPGDGDPVVFDVAGWQVGLLTCYDLRFPELCRALADGGADLFALPAAWVRGPLKEDHWTTLVRARAIENTCYVAAAAQAGSTYCGRSMLVDPLGVPLVSLGEQDGHGVGTVHTDRIREVRQRNPTLAHRRFTVVRRDSP